jgi:hypothetical protein
LALILYEYIFFITVFALRKTLRKSSVPCRHLTCYLHPALKRDGK